MKEFDCGIVFGSWDLLHPGHVVYLQTCAQYSHELIIGLHADPNKDGFRKPAVVETLFERWVRLNALYLEDCQFTVVPYTNEEDIENMLSMFSPDVYFLGEDYEGKEETITGYNLCEQKGIEIQLIERSHKLSTTRLKTIINRAMNEVIAI